jgi:SAM-dependent methyltransferase
VSNADDPALFYTGLVASLYTPLRSFAPDADTYARFIGKYGEPALELGCGTGDPILELRERGLDVDGIDISADMLDVCRARAAQLGVEVNVYEQRMEAMDLGRTYRSIFLAGPTFNLLPDDNVAVASLERIRAHLAPGGGALVPLFIPDPVPASAIGKWREDRDADDRAIRFTTLAATRDETARLQTSTLRYERGDGEDVEAVERDFVIHWYTVPGFRALVEKAGLTLDAVKDGASAPAVDEATFFFVRLTL